MWGWLNAIIKAVVAAVLDWWQRQRDKPNTIEDENAPDDIRKRGADAQREWLRNKNQDRGH